MRAIVWKISTFAAIGAAAFLALHPVGTSSSVNDVAKGPKAHPSSGGFWSFLGGATATDAPTSHTGTHLLALRNARNATETCEALRVLRTEATGDEEAISEIADHASASHPRNVRVCAISALELIPTAAARSYLTDLLNDSDTSVRDWAIRALAAKARDDADARSTVVAAAHSDDRDVRIAALVALGDAHVPEASALIQDALAHESGETRSRLINALGETRDPAAVSAIAQMLDDGSTNTRQAALEALGAIGGDAALKVLKDKLANGSREDINSAARALATTGDASAKQTLIDATQSSRRDEQLAAIRALSQLDGDNVRAAMVKSLHTADTQVVAAATSWFVSHADRAAVPDLATLLKTAPVDSHPYLVSALASIGGDDARDAIAMLAKTSGPDQLAALTQLSNMPGGREEGRKIALKVAKEGGQVAYTALALLGQDATPESRDALVTLARAGGETAQQAMTALAQHGDPEAVRALGDLARTAKTPQLRGQAIASLGSSGNPKNAPFLISAARDKDATVRRAAVAALGRVGGEGVERTLVDAASDSDLSTRTMAIRSLGMVQTSAAKSELEKLASSTDTQTARAAFQSLVGAAPDRAAALADRAMATGSTEMRQEIVQNAAQFPTETSKRILRSALQDSNETVATTAVNTLSNVGGADAQQALLDVLTNRDASAAVKQAAADALERSGSDMARQHETLINQYKSDTPPNGPTDESEDSDIDDG